MRIRLIITLFVKTDGMPASRSHPVPQHLLQQVCPFSLPVLINLLLQDIKKPASTAVVITILETVQRQKIALALQKIDPFILMVPDLLMAPNLLGSKAGFLLSSGANPRKGNTTSE